MGLLIAASGTSLPVLGAADDWRLSRWGSLSQAPDRDLPLTTEEAAYWLEEFAELEESPEIREASKPDPALLTDAEIARIQREVDAEE